MAVAPPVPIALAGVLPALGAAYAYVLTSAAWRITGLFLRKSNPVRGGAPGRASHAERGVLLWWFCIKFSPIDFCVDLVATPCAQDSGRGAVIRIACCGEPRQPGLHSGRQTDLEVARGRRSERDASMGGSPRSTGRWGPYSDRTSHCPSGSRPGEIRDGSRGFTRGAVEVLTRQLQFMARDVFRCPSRSAKLPSHEQATW